MSLPADSFPLAGSNDADPEPRRTYFSGTPLNQPVPLYQGPGIIEWNADAEREEPAGRVEGSVELHLAWMPRPHFAVSLVAESYVGGLLPHETNLTLPIGNGPGVNLAVSFAHSEGLR